MRSNNALLGYRIRNVSCQALNLGFGATLCTVDSLLDNEHFEHCYGARINGVSVICHFYIRDLKLLLYQKNGIPSISISNACADSTSRTTTDQPAN